VDVNALARQVVLHYLPLAQEKNQDLGWVHAYGDKAPPDSDVPPAGQGAAAAAMVAPVLARSEELHEALSNLVHNAVVYKPAGGTITVATRFENQAVCVEVCDNGPRIAADQRVAAFGRFVQLTKHAVPGAARHGAGLGLSIARAYAQRNGGISNWPIPARAPMAPWAARHPAPATHDPGGYPPLTPAPRFHRH
jgi:two-component system, OmpR family, sensor histidine kinase TctE